MHHNYWSIKNSIVDLSIRLKGNLKHIFGNLLSLFGAPEQGYQRCFADVDN